MSARISRRRALRRALSTVTLAARGADVCRLAGPVTGSLPADELRALRGYVQGTGRGDIHVGRTIYTLRRPHAPWNESGYLPTDPTTAYPLSRERA